MNRFTATVCVTLGLFCATAGLQAQEPAIPLVPNLQELQQPDELKEYTEAAEKFLREHVDSPHVPRVYADLIMVHGLAGNDAAEKQLREAILLVHPFSTYTAHVMRGFKTAEKSREFLDGFYKTWVLESLERPAVAQFTLGTLYASARFKDDLLSDDDFLLQCAAAGREIPVEPLLSRVKEKIAGSSEEIQQIAAVVMDKESSASDRFLKLQPFMKRTSVRNIQTLLWSESERAGQRAPGLLSTRVESLLRDSQFNEAYPLLQALSESDDERKYALWTAWAAAASGEKTVALEALGSIADDPKNSNGELAARLINALQHTNDTLEQQASTLLEVSQGIVNIDPAMELSGSFTPEEGEPLHFYIALNLPANFAEVIVRRVDHVMAVRIDGERATVLLPGEPVLHVFESGASLPRPQFQFNTTPDGRLNFKFNTSFGEGEQTADDPLRALFQSPIMSTKAGLQSLLASRLSGGTMSEFRLDEKSGDRILTWLAFNPDSPQPTISEMAIAPDGQLKSAHLDQLNISSIRYGDLNSFRFKPSPWPDHPIQRHESFPPSMMFRLFSELSTLMESGE